MLCDEILIAQKELAEKFGLLAEPSCAATLAAYKKMITVDGLISDDKVLLMITGNGLKDSNVLIQWNEKPSARSYSDWLNILC